MRIEDIIAQQAEPAPDLGDRALFWTARTFGLSIDRLYAVGAFRLLMMALRKLSSILDRSPP